MPGTLASSSSEPNVSESARNDWWAIAAYALVAAANQMLWLTFAPVTTDSALYFGVSEGAIGTLSEIFPLLFVLLAIPAGLMLDRWLRPVLLIAAGLSATGAMVRLAGDSYTWLLAGQMLVAIAQPAILGAITKLSDERLAPASRARGISIAAASTFAGAVAALALGTLIGVEDGPSTLLRIGAAFAAFAFVGLLFALRASGAKVAETSSAPGVRELRAIWGDSTMRRLAAIAFLGFGIFVALTTWLQVLLEPRGISSETAGLLLMAMTMSGAVGAVVLPTPVIRRGAERRMMRVAACATSVGCVALALNETVAVAAVSVVVLGFFLLSALPVLLDLTDRHAGQTGATAATLIWLAGNAGGIAIALLVQAISSHPAAAFAAAAALVVMVVPLTRSRSLVVNRSSSGAA